MKILAEVELRPTEDEAKVKSALLNIMTPCRLSINERGSSKVLVAEAESPGALEKLHVKLRRQQILDAARAMMLSYSNKDKVLFYLHKQAAFMDVVAFCQPEGESPLGSIKVEITGVDAKAVVDWLAPPTLKGKPLFEGGPPR
ncbi:MAG: RNA-binding domain-containing protein [Candidatus Nezhaarchaeota archaeon]|nr:RNA-binding domain-containing protein [Candidatus Nezhaarchaeota archaeon]